jgi:VCBS repeat-containing protein
VASDAAITTDEDTLTTFDLRTHAHDVDGNLLDAAIIAAPLHGRLTRSDDGRFTYTPDADFFGADSFTYRVHDGELNSNIATVSLTVSPVNDAPVASDAALTTSEDTALVIDLRNYGSDADNAALTPVIIEPPVHGSLTLNDDGSYTYTPHANYFGSDALRFKFNDDELDSNIATMSFNVTPVNDAPVVVNGSASMLDNETLRIDFRLLGSDIDSPTLMPVIVGGPAHGSLSLNADGSYTFTPVYRLAVTETIQFALDDGELLSNTATYTIEVARSNVAPVARDSTVPASPAARRFIRLRRHRRAAAHQLGNRRQQDPHLHPGAGLAIGGLEPGDGAGRQGWRPAGV